MNNNIKAFKDRIIYQIYPLSFKDSNNDGIGDLNGITESLDYLKELGVGIIWLCPIYKSPMVDNGYDIADYYEINPIFGTMKDFENLIKEADRKDIKVVMDFVVNHTSDQNKWFQEALKNKNSKYRNYYYFMKGKANGEPPNNWNSAFSGPCWELVDKEENIYYLHLFSKEQPDLNYHNEEVIKEVENILKFWLDKGVYGFRCDVINKLYKTSFEDGKKAFFNCGCEHYANQEGNFQVLERFRKDVLDNYDTFLVGETFGITPEIGNEYLRRRCLDMFFEFEHNGKDTYSKVQIIKRKYDPAFVLKQLFKWQKEVDWMSVYLENHDQLRSINRYGDIKKYYLESGKALATLLLTLRGTIFIYQGEELGMLDYRSQRYEEINDCATLTAIKTAKKICPFFSRNFIVKLCNKTVNRDNSRSPFLWNRSINAGFNIGEKPWLKPNEIYKEGINVEDELKDNNSILNYYKKLIKFHNQSDILKFGSVSRLPSNKKIAKFIREYEGKKLLIIVNITKNKIKENLIEYLNKPILFSNYEEHSAKYLKPYEAIIFQID